MTLSRRLAACRDCPSAGADPATGQPACALNGRRHAQNARDGTCGRGLYAGPPAPETAADVCLARPRYKIPDWYGGEWWLDCAGSPGCGCKK